jgi:AcrR family transcriptional regulator
VNVGGRRNQILRAAERLLGRYGPSKTTIADVAREADIGVGSVYLEFPSKEAIVEELSMARHQYVLDAMKKAAEPGNGSFSERLAGIFEARTTALLSLADEGAHACDLVHCMSPAVKAAQARFAERERALVADLLRQGARAGDFDVPKPELSSRTILQAYLVFSPPSLFAIPREEVRKALKAMHQLVLFGVLARRPP